MKKVQQHPAWKNAAEKILERFSKEGHGMVVRHEKLESWLNLDGLPPDQKRQEKRSAVRYLKQYFWENKIDLRNVYGEGYMIMKPNDIPDDSAKRFATGTVRLSRTELIRLQSIDLEKCNQAAKQKRLRLMDTIGDFSKHVVSRVFKVCGMKFVEIGPTETKSEP